MEATRKVVFWDRLSIGNPDIDRDHKELLEVYNDLVDLIDFQKSREEFARILSRMTDYSLGHFKKEEKYMKDLSYPKLKEHMDNHRNYIYKVAMFNFDLLSPTPPDPEEIIDFLKKWWMNHILKHDTQFEAFKNDNKLDVRY